MRWNIRSDAPVYSQLVEHIKLAIISGEFPLGSRLPSVRELAAEAGVNPNTMPRAFAELEREGLCETRRGLGTFITPEQSRIDALRERMALDALNRFLSSLKALGMTREDAAAMLNMKEE